jgi:hypothetical protein
MGRDSINGIAREPVKRLSILATALAAVTGAVLLTGCGGEKAYHLSGTVTFKGKPVPVGQIVFEPDPSAGNKGQAAYAKIKDGHYDTREEGQGTVGGPHIVTIHGRDGVARGELMNGLPLFRDFVTQVDLPKAETKHDFEVPADNSR